MKNFGRLIKLFFVDRSAIFFLVAVICGLSFSISIIFSATGLMEGFKSALTKTLQHDYGDIIITGRRHFFMPQTITKFFPELEITQFATVVVSESFLIAQGRSQGVLVKGIDQSYLHLVNHHKLPRAREIILGEALAEQLALKEGDEVSLMFAAGNHQLEQTPILENFIVAGIEHSAIYQEERRVVYLNQQRLQKILNLQQKINQLSLRLPRSFHYPSQEQILNFRNLLRHNLGFEFQVKAFWEKYQGLLKAVKVEEFYIVSILQIIVIVSIFNIVALLFYIGEQKRPQLFLLQVLGMKQRALNLFWYQAVGLLWSIAVSLALAITYFYNYALQSWSIFKVPGSVYHLSRFQIELNILQIVIIIVLVLFIMLLVTGWSLSQMKRKPLVEKMRRL